MPQVVDQPVDMSDFKHREPDGLVKSATHRQGMSSYSTIVNCELDMVGFVASSTRSSFTRLGQEEGDMVLDTFNAVLGVESCSEDTSSSTSTPMICVENRTDPSPMQSPAVSFNIDEANPYVNPTMQLSKQGFSLRS